MITTLKTKSGTTWAVEITLTEDTFAAKASDPVFGGGAEITVSAFYPAEGTDREYAQKLILRMLQSALEVHEEGV